MTSVPTVPIDELLRHRTWVRSLARSLVRDAAAADDVEQEVWVRALRSPPHEAAAVRSWLGRVVRSVVHDRHRSDSRRAVREAAQPPGREPETAFDIVTRTESHRDLVNEVLALPDPYRRAILMRFFDGLTLGEIAAQTGARPETVRKQVQRARAMLRERIETGREGGLRALVLPIVGTAWLAPSPVGPGSSGAAGSGVATTAAAVGGVAVGSKGKATVVAMVVLLLGLMGGVGALVMEDDSPGDVSEPESAVLESAPEAAPIEGGTAAAAVERTTAAGRRERERVSGESTGGSDGATDANAPEATLVPLEDALPGELRGRVVDLEGKVIANVTVVAYRGREQISLTHVGDDGSFHLDELPEGEFRVGFSAPGYVSQHISSEAGGAALSVTLEVAHPIHGVVNDLTTGEPVEGVPVYLFPERSPDARSLAFARTDAEGRFRLDQAPEGAFDIQVGYRMSLHEASFEYVPVRMEGVSGAEEPLAIALDPGLEISGRFIDAHSELVRGDFDVRVRGRTEQGDRDQSRSRLLRTAGDGTFRIAGLREGNYDVTFSPAEPDEGEEAPRVGGTQVLEAVDAGTTGIDVRLDRAATISGRLTDENGLPIVAKEGWMQAVPAESTPGGPGTVWIKFAEDGTFTSPPLDANRSYDLQAGMIPGHRTGKVSGIAAGATDVVLRLPRATSVSGTVKGADGKPVGVGVPVLAIAEDVSLDGTPGSVAFAYTDAQGRFTIDGLGEFTYQVAAGGGKSAFRPTSPKRGIAFGATDVALEVRAGAVLSGKLLDKDGNPVKAPYLSVTSPGLLQFESHTRVESEDGSFEIASLPPGTHRAAVVIGETRYELGEVKVPAKDVELRLPDLARPE